MCELVNVPKQSLFRILNESDTSNLWTACKSQRSTGSQSITRVTFYYQVLLYFFSVVHQSYQTQVVDEYVLRGNSATLKCLVPSFVADFVFVTEWMDEEGQSFQSGDILSGDGK